MELLPIEVRKPLPPSAPPPRHWTLVSRELVKMVLAAGDPLDGALAAAMYRPGNPSRKERGVPEGRFRSYLRDGRDPRPSGKDLVKARDLLRKYPGAVQSAVRFANLPSPVFVYSSDIPDYKPAISILMLRALVEADDGRRTAAVANLAAMIRLAYAGDRIVLLPSRASFQARPTSRRHNVDVVLPYIKAALAWGILDRRGRDLVRRAIPNEKSNEWVVDGIRADFQRTLLPSLLHRGGIDPSFQRLYGDANLEVIPTVRWIAAGQRNAIRFAEGDPSKRVPRSFIQLPQNEITEPHRQEHYLDEFMTPDPSGERRRRQQEEDRTREAQIRCTPNSLGMLLARDYAGRLAQMVQNSTPTAIQWDQLRALLS